MVSVMLALALLCQPTDAAATAALEKFKTAYKAKEVADRAAAVTELAKTAHDKVYAKLGAVLLVDDTTVRIAAAKGLGTAEGEHRKKAVNYLSRAFGPNAGETLVVVAMVEAMEAMQEGLGYDVLKGNLKSPDAPTSRASIEAMGQIRDKSFLVPLIEHARNLEAAARETMNVGPGGRTVTGGGIPGVGGPVGDPDAPKRSKLLVPLIHKALESITKQSFKTVAEWVDWWRKSGADFKVQK